MFCRLWSAEVLILALLHAVVVGKIVIVNARVVADGAILTDVRSCRQVSREFRRATDEPCVLTTLAGHPIRQTADLGVTRRVVAELFLNLTVVVSLVFRPEPCLSRIVIQTRVGLVVRRLAPREFTHASTHLGCIIETNRLEFTLFVFGVDDEHEARHNSSDLFGRGHDFSFERTSI